MIDWIDFYSHKFLRFNRDDFFKDIRPNFAIELTSNTEEFKLRNVDINKAQSIWFRRSIYPFLPDTLAFESLDNHLSEDVKRSFYYEYLNCTQLFYSQLEKVSKKLGDFRKVRINKLEVLKMAKECSIDIPASIITSKKIDVHNFRLKKGRLITKAISEIFDVKTRLDNKTNLYINYTQEITERILEEMPESFSYSLFQEKLDKEIEIRTFFLDGKCYSMAMFSQLDRQTSVDFRKYSNNRRVPYKLPNQLESNISKLMTKLDLNTGSVDIVKTIDKRYVFLEVNPTGQYGMVSDPCNYYLDKKIAEYLIGHGEN